MGFFSWLFCSILVVALVLLLFPFSVRIEFEAGERGARALFFFFKKKVYEYKKKWGKEEANDEQREKKEKSDSTGSSTDLPTLRDPEPRGGEGASNVEDGHREANEQRQVTEEAEAKAPAAPKEEHKAAPAESKIEEEKKDTPKVIASKPIEVKSSDAREEAKEEEKTREEEKKEKPKKEKRKLSDREFWTILLTPDLDARAFRYVLKIIASVFSLFRIRFYGCFIEGIQMGYQEMGYVAALNGIMKAYPYVGEWDLRMDWCHEKELRAAGTVRIGISLLRIFCFVLETLVMAGILAFSFWRRRARIIKTNELPELGFFRKKILDLILED